MASKLEIIAGNYRIPMQDFDIYLVSRDYD